uniref:Uncharacterized protein n=1 Tax=viral metagenome TaxID=1070528 RepID=A0A6C0AF99_9ZZZZ
METLGGANRMVPFSWFVIDLKRSSNISKEILGSVCQILKDWALNLYYSISKYLFELE